MNNHCNETSPTHLALFQHVPCVSAFNPLSTLKVGVPLRPPLCLRSLRSRSSPSSLSSEGLSLGKGSGNQTPLNPVNPLTAYGKIMAISKREKIPRESFVIKQLSPDRREFRGEGEKLFCISDICQVTVRNTLWSRNGTLCPL